MCVYEHAYMYISAGVYVWVYTCIYIHVYVYMYVYACLYIDFESQEMSHAAHVTRENILHWLQQLLMSVRRVQ